jgi:hypothetical protein
VELSQPAILSVPLGFLACILGTLLSKEETKAERGFPELHVRAETGLGAEVPIEGAGLRPREPQRPREPEREPATTAAGR